METKHLEGKFKEQHDGNPGKWLSRMILEPGYALRNVMSLPKDTPNLSSLKKQVIGYEIIRLGGYGVVAYSLIEAFVK